MTSCRLPKPDWQLISRSIEVVNDKATTRNSFFEFWHIPLFYLPFLARNLDETGRESGFCSPAAKTPAVKGLVFGEQVYWAINRSMDLTVGAQYWSKRGFAPNGRLPLSRPWPGRLHRALECACSTAAFEEVAPRPDNRRQPSSIRAEPTSSLLAASTSRPTPALPAPSNIFPATSTAWPSTKTSPRPPVPRCRATSRSLTITMASSRQFELERFQTFAGISANPDAGRRSARSAHPAPAHASLRRRRSSAARRSCAVSPIYWGLGVLDRRHGSRRAATSTPAT